MQKGSTNPQGTQMFFRNKKILNAKPNTNIVTYGIYQSA